VLLFVCHANLCRSPMAERLALSVHKGSVVSAGTHARPGDPMHPLARDTLTLRGADPSGFRSRRVTPDLVVAAGLVLTATREQRSICVSLAPSALARTFTIRQFGRIATVLGAAPTGGLEAALAQVPQARGELPPVDPADDDLTDPVNGTAADFSACAALIESALEPTLALLTPAP
jgi:protein-tyrosine phosphatase